MKQRVTRGGCLCGAVRYEAKGEPYNITHCHCADCRGSSGAAFVTWASFRRAGFRFTKGKARALKWARRLRSFCGQCGTPLTFMTDSKAEEVDITVCSLDEPESVTPADHTWEDDKLPWIKITDGLPGYRRGRESR